MMLSGNTEFKARGIYGLKPWSFRASENQEEDQREELKRLKRSF